MNKELFRYMQLDKFFYEDYCQKGISTEFIDIVSRKIDSNWNFIRNGFFLNYISNVEIPTQGWKIHISATLKNIRIILDIASDILIKNKITFKILLDTETYTMTGSKSYPRESYGKFITVYPKDLDQFKYIIEKLYNALKDYNGPYILSDKRYRDSKVIYYRYGGFSPNYGYDMEGNPIPLIKNEIGNYIEDVRLPYFSLPDGITDIFSNEIDDSSSILTKKYNLTSAIMFSNSGGVYLGTRKSDNLKVIIKEARPHTQYLSDEIEAVYIRKEEFKRLNELISTGYVPRVLDNFYDWEHYFIVEEFIDGITLDEFVITKNPIYRLGGAEQVKNYLIDLVKIFIEIATFTLKLHNKNYVYSDFSLQNILITSSNEVRIVDLEGCVNGDNYPFRVVSKGFYDDIKSNDLYASDVYGIGCLLFSCLIKKNNLIEIQPDTVSIFLKSICNEYKLPSNLVKLILDMTNKDISKRPKIKAVLNKLFCILEDIKVATIDKTIYTINSESLYGMLGESINLGINGIISSQNKTSLSTFPNTPILSNNFNISNGLCGVVYGFNYLGVSSFNTYLDEMIVRLKHTDPIGLYVGNAGVIWTLIETNQIDKAEYLYQKYLIDSNYNGDFSVYSGVSGIGLVTLKLFLNTNNSKYLKLAIGLGDLIINEYNFSENISIGYKKGNSGIALYLLYLTIASNDTRYSDIGEVLLLNDIQYAVISSDFNAITFPSSKLNNIASPYFLEGTSGVLAVLLRYYSYTNKDIFLNYSIKFADSLNSKYSISPTLFKGLSGIANSLLDAYYILNNSKYKTFAETLANECLSHEIKYDDGILYPDLYISKLSTDFGYGTIGILMFYKRLLSNDKNNFLCFLDELIKY